LVSLLLLFYSCFHRVLIYTLLLFILSFFFFNATATTEIYTLSLHDALPIFCPSRRSNCSPRKGLPSKTPPVLARKKFVFRNSRRSEEHTSELQSRFDLVCRLLLEKKKKKTK